MPTFRLVCLNFIIVMELSVLQSTRTVLNSIFFINSIILYEIKENF